MADSLDETETFQPRFDAEGLIPAIVTDARDGTVLMFAHMNAEALRLTLDTGICPFLEPLAPGTLEEGRNLRRTAAGHGNPHRLRSGRAAGEGPAAQGRGAACHTGRRSCFYRRIDKGRLVFVDQHRFFDPKSVYRS